MADVGFAESFYGEILKCNRSYFRELKSTPMAGFEAKMPPGLTLTR